MFELLTGAIAAASLIAGVFFFRFWRHTRDRLFLLFSGSFCLEAVNRVVLGLSSQPDEHEPLFYTVRLVSYTLILVAIWGKNRGSR